MIEVKSFQAIARSTCSMLRFLEVLTSSNRIRQFRETSWKIRCRRRWESVRFFRYHFAGFAPRADERQCMSFIVGLLTCFDLRFPELSLSLRRRGAQLLTFPSAFTVKTGESAQSLARSRARLMSRSLVQVRLIGVSRSNHA